MAMLSTVMPFRMLRACAEPRSPGPGTRPV